MPAHFPLHITYEIPGLKMQMGAGVAGTGAPVHYHVSTVIQGGGNRPVIRHLKANTSMSDSVQL